MSTAFLVEQRFPVDVPAMLADPIDLRTGELLSIESGYDPTDGAVFTSLRTVRGSGSAVEDCGQQFHKHELVDPQLEPFFREEVKFALGHLLEARQIRLERVEILKGDDFGELQLKYVNAAQERERDAQARVGELAVRR